MKTAVRSFFGNVGILVRGYCYIRTLGPDGLREVSDIAVLNANYLLARLKQAGFDAAYPSRRASHEFIITLKRQARELEVTTMDFAKRLLDHDCLRHHEREIDRRRVEVALE